MIKVIVFDLGNVLIPFDYNRILIRLNSIKEGLGDRFYNRYKDNYHVHRQYERWELNEEEFLKVMLEWCEHEVNAEEFCHIYSDLFTENEQTTELLPKLKESYTLVLLSNTNFIHQKYGWEKYKFLKNFDKLILSHEVGAVKPEEKIYKAVENYTNVEPEAHIFIDDIEEYALGAKQMGWDAIHFKDADQLKFELKQREIIF
jgi:HAD superfamily hydrolase (TIGR01509 family)